MMVPHTVLKKVVAPPSLLRRLPPLLPSVHKTLLIHSNPWRFLISVHKSSVIGLSELDSRKSI